MKGIERDEAGKPTLAERDVRRSGATGPGAGDALVQAGVLALVLIALGGRCLGTPASQNTTRSSGTNAFITQPMSLAEAVNVALQQNPNILQRQKDLEAAAGVVIQTRAIALPRSAPRAITPRSVHRYRHPALADLGFQLRLRPELGLADPAGSIPLRRRADPFVAARRPADQGALAAAYQTAVADTVLEVQLAYYDVLLARRRSSCRRIRRAAHQRADRHQPALRRRHRAPFNVLRAQVELGNQQPKLIRAGTATASPRTSSSTARLQRPQGHARGHPP